MTRTLPLLTLFAVLAACSHPPAAYRDADITSPYTIGNHLFDVRAIPAPGGYDVYVAERGGPFLSDYAFLDTAKHLEAAEIVLGDRCPGLGLVEDWRSYGQVGFTQPSLGIIARYRCS